MPHRVAILGGRLNVLEGAAAVGVSAVLLHKPDAPDPRAHRLCEQVVPIDLDDMRAVEKAVTSLHGQRPFDRVISLTEPCLMVAAQLNERLGLGGNSLETVTLLKNKAAMRARLASSELSPVRTRVVSSVGEISGFLDEVAGPLVIKPTDGMGQRHVL